MNNSTGYNRNNKEYKKNLKERNSSNDETTFNRAKERALYILERGEKTEYQIRQKLSDGGYIDEIIDRVIEFLKGYNYVNDFDYSCKYIKYKISSKSIRNIKNDLYNKGVNKEVIEEALIVVNPDDTKTLESIFLKKYSKYDLSDYGERNKAFIGLMRKGFTYDDISGLLNRYKDD